ncbi:Glycosyltransferase [Actinokineospora spheciospongiae]|uniref:Glycosyltransferase n=1 Tax=Actinokineospora spheciospongiae TaxID=909613 RepID=W7J2N5_9PSEU|nr:glycosyltransferase family 4 protein [Actinokineospora spheciospongiae]EWC60394.1 Glycosyltransferase [Actinokineospora spheciospongiae]
MTAPLRVTLVTPGFPPERGGVEAHTGHLARELSARGVDVRVLTARRGVPRPVLERPGGVPVRVFPAWRTTVMSISPRLLLAGLRAGRGSDVVHVHSYHAACGFAALGGFARPVVFTPHYHGGGHSRQASALHVVYRFVGRLLFRAARAVVCVSRAERDQLVGDFPGAADRAHVVPNGVDVAAIRAAEPFPDQPRTVLSLGRLEPYKRVAALLRALPLLPPDVQVVVVGTGSQSDELRGLAADLGVAGRVRFTGGVDDHQVHRWLRTAAVLVSLSEHEAFGMAPVEAAAAGAGVVLSDIPAHREIAAEHLGGAARLVGPEPAAVAAAVTQALAETRRDEADVPDWGRIAEETLAIYRSALRGED